MIEQPKNIIRFSCNRCRSGFEADFGTAFLEFEFLEKSRKSADYLLNFLVNRKELQKLVCFSKEIACNKCGSSDCSLTEEFNRFLMREFSKEDSHFTQDLMSIVESKISRKWSVPNLVIGKFDSKIEEERTRILPREAEKYYRKKIEGDKNNPVLHERLGNLLRSMFRYEEAKEEYNKAIELDEKMHGSYYNLGLIYALDDRLDKAEETFIKLRKVARGMKDEKERELALDNVEACLKIISGLKRKRGLHSIPIIDNAVVLKVAENIHEMFYKEFPNSAGKAAEMFEEESRVKKPENKEEEQAIDMEYFYWLATDFELENGLTPAEYYLKKKEEELSFEERIAVESLANSRRGFYKVLKTDGRNYLLEDVFNLRKFDVLTHDMRPLKEEDMIIARLLPVGINRHSFIGAVSVPAEYEEIKKEFEEDLEKKIKAAAEYRKKFAEYFKTDEPEFPDMKNAEKAMNGFLESEEIGEEIKFSLEGLEEAYKAPVENKRIGIVFSGWINIIPFYGYIKDIFAGKHESVPDYGDLLDAVIRRGEFIPGYLLKKLAYENRETCVKAFSEVFEWVENFDDVLAVLGLYRADLDEKEFPHLFFENSGKKKKSGARTLLMKAERLIDEKRFDEAEAALNELERLEPDNPLVFYRKAALNFMRMRLFEALKNIDKSLRLEPNSFDSAILKAEILHRMRRRDHIRWIAKAREIDRKKANDYMKNYWAE